jgi:hypothetical protein
VRYATDINARFSPEWQLGMYNYLPSRTFQAEKRIAGSIQEVIDAVKNIYNVHDARTWNQCAFNSVLLISTFLWS